MAGTSEKSANKVILIVNNDSTEGEIWERRLESYLEKNNISVSVISLTTPYDLECVLKYRHEHKLPVSLILMDELSSGAYSGQLVQRMIRDGQFGHEELNQWVKAIPMAVLSGGSSFARMCKRTSTLCQHLVAGSEVMIALDPPQAAHYKDNRPMQVLFSNFLTFINQALGIKQIDFSGQPS